jgi:hypothetical protein
VAILQRLTVEPASREQFLALDERIGQALARAGGPPSGLMATVVHPDGHGFVIAGVWRTEVDAERNLDDLLRPLLAEVGLVVARTTVSPVWSFARP